MKNSTKSSRTQSATNRLGEYASPTSENGDGHSFTYLVYEKEDLGVLEANGIASEILPPRAGFEPRGKHLAILYRLHNGYEAERAQIDGELYQHLGAAAVRLVYLPGWKRTQSLTKWLASWSLEVIHETAIAFDDLPPPPPVVPIFEDQASKPIVTVRGDWTSCLHNSVLWLEREGLAPTLRYDRFRQAILNDGRKLDDETVIALARRVEASLQTVWCLDHMRHALVHVAHRNSFSSLTEWLDSLRWDGTTRLDRFFAEAYGCELGPYEEACAKVLFLSGVARAYQPGCQADVMVVLIGPQGLGKSMGISALCPDPDWFADDLGCDLFDHKAGEGLRGKWLIEFAEFSRINRATIDVVKSFISRRIDYYRPAYGRMHKDFPRTCVFVGTTNADHPLHDRQNRRFMPIRCVEARKEWIQAHRDQLWAEAVARYRQGEPWWVRSPTLLEEIAARQEEARQDDAWESILQEKLGHLHTITMETAAEALHVGTDRLDRSTQTRIGLVLKSLGYDRTRPWGEGKRPYVWSK